MKNKIISGVIFCSIFVVIFISCEIYSGKKLEVKSSSISYVYNSDQLKTTVTGAENVEKLDTELKNIELENQKEVLNTNVVDSVTIFEQVASDSKVVDNIVENISTLVHGYTITIDGTDFYVANISDYDEAISDIYRSLLPNEELYSKYRLTKEVPSFTVGNKKFTNIIIESKVTIKEDFVDGDKILTNKEDILFYLLHGNEEKKVEKISPTLSTKAIKEMYGLTDTDMKLNNNGLDNSTLLYDGQEIIVNKLNAQIQIATYYEEDQVEPIPFHTQRNENPDMPKGDENIIQPGKDGSKVVTYKTKLVNNDFDSTTEIRSDVIERSEDLIIEVGTKSAVNTSVGNAPTYATGVLLWPSSGGVMCGWYCYGGHAAIDIQAWYGAPIYAADSGTVTLASWYGGGGNTVIINHQNSIETTYMHLSSTAVSAGQYVSKGQVIGYEGGTGTVTVHHLHFVVRVNGSVVNPMNFY